MTPTFFKHMTCTNCRNHLEKNSKGYYFCKKCGFIYMDKLETELEDLTEED